VFAIRAAHAFTDDRFRAGGATVFVDAGRIVGVEPARRDVPSSCPVVDHGEATVLPGLIECHVHLVADCGVQALDRVCGRSQAELDATVTESLRRHLGAGVTTVRDLGDRGFGVVARRDVQRALDDGLPWIVASGPPLTFPGGHCHLLGGEVFGREQIEAAVRERAERGVDVVKLMASGGFNTMGTDVFTPQFTLDELQLIVARAHGVGLPVTAHAHAAAAVDQAVAGGVDGIEHATFLVRTPGAGSPGAPLKVDEVATDDQLDVLAAGGIPVCPTMGGAFDPAMFANVPAHGKQSLEP
jgi:imidazolonepropionase-like amidohydrolase